MLLCLLLFRICLTQLSDAPSGVQGHFKLDIFSISFWQVSKKLSHRSFMGYVEGPLAIVQE